MRQSAANFRNPSASTHLSRADRLRHQRLQMVTQLQGWSIRDPSVLRAMVDVHRHLFVPSNARDIAYEDRPIALPEGQTLSAPHVIAYMLELAELKPEHRVLEIGTGSGYQTALMCQLAKTVCSVEVCPKLLEVVHQLFGQWGNRNAHFKVGNGLLGWAARAPYDRILVSAAVTEIPVAWIEQLAIGGKLIVPVGARTEAGEVSDRQVLQVITRTELGLTQKDTISVTFDPIVPLLSPTLSSANPSVDWRA